MGVQGPVKGQKVLAGESTKVGIVGAGKTRRRGGNMSRGENNRETSAELVGKLTTGLTK